MAATEKESRISAHHNYLVNDALTPGFTLGDPGAKTGFYFLADVVLPGESTPRISARLYDGSGALLVELLWNRIKANPGDIRFQSMPYGFRLLLPSGEAMLSVRTERFTNGYLSRVQGKLYDEAGTLRMEPSPESVTVYGEASLTLEAPFEGMG